MADGDELATVRKRPPVVAQTPANTSGHREEILLAASVLPEIPIDDFLLLHLPRVDAKKVTKVTKELKKDPAWHDFTRIRPVDRTENEVVAFVALSSFYTFIAARFEVADHLGRVDRTMLNMGSITPQGSYFHVLTRPDAGVYLSEVSTTNTPIVGPSFEQRGKKKSSKKK